MNYRQRALCALTMVGALALAGCEGGESPSTDSVGDPSWRESLLKEAPVADESDIPKDSVLWDIHESGKFVYGGSKTQKLFSQLNPTTNELEGFDASMALLMAKYLTGEAKVDEKIITSETREPLLQNGTIPVAIYTYSITPEREKKVDQAGPYFISGQSIAVREDTDDIMELSDLKNRDVCVTKGGTAYLTMKAKVPSAKLVTLESSTECEQMLRQKRVDAEVQDEAILLGQAAEGGLKVVGDPLTYEPYGIGLPNDSPEAVKFVNQWLKELIESGLWQEVYDNTVGEVPGAEAQVPTPGKKTTPELNLD